MSGGCVFHQLDHCGDLILHWFGSASIFKLPTLGWRPLLAVSGKTVGGAGGGREGSEASQGVCVCVCVSNRLLRSDSWLS